VCFDEQSQTSLYGRLLCAGAATTHGLVHQLIVDFDIRPHGGHLDV
jgi:hypothetical protein